MGVDYSAHLAYGVEVNLDQPAFEDGIYEYEVLYAESMMKAMGIEGDAWQFLRGMPCPVNIMAFGAPNYDGKGTYVITPNEFCHSADMYGGSSVEPVDIGQPDPTEAAKAIKDFCELTGIEVPEQEPRWYFGLYVS